MSASSLSGYQIHTFANSGNHYHMVLLSQAPNDNKKGNGLKLHQGRFRLDIRRNFFTGRVLQHWNRLPRDVVESPSLKVLKKPVDLGLSSVV